MTLIEMLGVVALVMLTLGMVADELCKDEE
jgi:hypothetical protein